MGAASGAVLTARRGAGAGRVARRVAAAAGAAGLRRTASAAPPRAAHGPLARRAVQTTLLGAPLAAPRPTGARKTSVALAARNALPIRLAMAPALFQVAASARHRVRTLLTGSREERAGRATAGLHRRIAAGPRSEKNGEPLE